MSSVAGLYVLLSEDVRSSSEECTSFMGRMYNSPNSPENNFLPDSDDKGTYYESGFVRQAESIIARRTMLKCPSGLQVMAETDYFSSSPFSL